jgi:pSer/pThr/pTyr-binding forkhead associated (FHA) protein
MAILILINEKEETVFELEKGTVVIGRNSKCDIVLTGNQISNHHAMIFTDGDHQRIEDLESCNGTCVNGQEIKSMLLRDGDRINLADTVLVYHVNKMQQTARRIKPTRERYNE